MSASLLVMLQRIGAGGLSRWGMFECLLQRLLHLLQICTQDNWAVIVREMSAATGSGHRDDIDWVCALTLNLAP